MINITCFWSFGSILGLFGPFFIFSHKTWFFAYKTQRASWQKWFGAKTKVLCEMTKKSPNGPKMAPNGQKHVILIIWGHFGPSWTTLGHWQACHVWPFLAPKGPFWTPCTHDWRMAMAKTASNQLGICLRIMHVRRIPKVSMYMAVTT